MTTNTFNWKLTLRLNILILKIVGLWPKRDETFKLNFYLMQTIFLLTIFLIGHISFQAINIFFIFNDLQAVTGTIFVLSTEVMAIFKSYYLIKNMKILKRLMVMLSKHPLFQPQNDKQIDLVKPALNLWSFIYYTLTVMSFGAILFWAVFPVLDQTAQERRLPFLAWYPFDFKVSPYYELTYIHQIVSTSYIATVNLNIDTLIAGLNMYIGTQFDILSSKLRNITSLHANDKLLIECISHHKLILRFTQDSNTFYEPIIFLQFFISALSLALTMFQLTIVTPFTSEFYSLISFTNAVIVQIFMYCWFGNEVEVKSGILSYSAFKSDWTQFPATLKKDLIFFLLRSQKGVKLSAFNLFYLSLETFVKILRTAWSSFAVLHQLNARTQ